MTERFKVHAWKACVLQKGTEGSNPSLSAILQSQAPPTVWGGQVMCPVPRFLQQHGLVSLA